MGVSLIKIIFSGEDPPYAATLFFFSFMEHSSDCLCGRAVAGVGRCDRSADDDGGDDGGELRWI